METSPDQIAALADELASLAKGLAAAGDIDPMTKRHQTHAVVMKAKSLINQIQDPLEACMDHTTNVSSLTYCHQHPHATMTTRRPLAYGRTTRESLAV